MVVSTAAQNVTLLDSGHATTDQICRSCCRYNNKKFYKCSPELEADFVAFNDEPAPVHFNSPTNVPLRLKKRSEVPSLLSVGPKKVSDPHTLVETCGQQVQDKCLKCARFSPITARVKTLLRSRATGKVERDRFKIDEVIVGGHCTIGPEGVTRGTQVVFCDPKPKRPDIVSEYRGSCATCKFQGREWGTTMLHHVSPIRFDLNPYQAYLARNDPMIGDQGEPQVGLTFYWERIRVGQVPWRVSPHSTNTAPAFRGLWRFYGANIVKTELDAKGREIAYHVLVPTYGDVVRFEADNCDLRRGVITALEGKKAVIEFLSPYQHDFGFGERDSFARPVLEHDTCPNCKGTATRLHGTKKVPCEYCDGPGASPRTKGPNDPWFGKRATLPRSWRPNSSTKVVVESDLDPRCVARGMDKTAATNSAIYCHPKWGPCYFHAKKPTKIETVSWTKTSEQTGAGEYKLSTDIVFQRPAAHDPIAEANPARALKIVRTNGFAQVVDQAGNPPTPVIFQIQVRHLLSYARNKTERKEIFLQYLKVMEQTSRGRTRQLNFSWIRPCRVEPMHPVCYVNETDRSEIRWSTTPEGKTRIESGHRDGDPELAEVIFADGTYHEIDHGQLTRGIDFARDWNDAFGTPRGEQSTNPLMHTISGGGVVVLGGKVVTEACGAPQHLIRDPKFCWPKAQELEEWIRTTNPGERLQEEMLINEALLIRGRELYRRGYMPATTKRQKPILLRYLALYPAFPSRANVEIPSHHTILEPHMSSDGYIHYDYYWAETKKRRPTIIAQLVDYLDTPTFVEGSDQTNSVGYWATNRTRVLGYDNGRVRAKGNADKDIVSVAHFANMPISDDATPASEDPEQLICEHCFDPRTGQGIFKLGTGLADFACPNCGGKLILRTRRSEWLAAILRVDAAGLRQLVPGFRKGPNTALVSAPDSSAYLTNQRLYRSGCKHWVSNRSRR